MEEINWFFKESPDTMVLTTKDVVIKRCPILFVSHDLDDGMWQFHSNEQVDMNEAMLVSLQEIVTFDFSITNISSLPLGWIAFRDNLQSSWSTKEYIE